MCAADTVRTHRQYNRKQQFSHTAASMITIVSVNRYVTEDGPLRKQKNNGTHPNRAPSGISGCLCP
jgi:hypothetical protein